MQRLIALLAALTLLLTGCSAVQGEPGQKQYTATFLALFDTVSSVVGRAESEEAFQTQAQAVHDRLLEYHRLFDIYHSYDGIHNLYTVNAAAGGAPVAVDPAIIALLQDCKTYWNATNGRVNAAMGSVLSLWHEARTAGLDDPDNARLPDTDALEAAGAHTDFDAVILDVENSTVCITDPLVQLDVGAIAKGWAAQRVCEDLPSGWLLSVGGNVCATGPKDEKGTAWVVGIQDPDSSGYLHTLRLTQGSIVTSGDYQRTYTVDGTDYHHIIDPDTLYPSAYWRSVTVVCGDSGLADALSTALFLLPQAEGQQLLDTFGAEAMWVDAGGDLFYSPGFSDLIVQ